MLTDEVGTVTDKYDYDAFGNIITQTSSPSGARDGWGRVVTLPVANTMLFAGEQFDPDLGLYYNRARYLDTRVGRFWGVDTYEGNTYDSLSLHSYLYVGGNPVNAKDPSGKLSLLDKAIAGMRVHSRIGVDFLSKVPWGFSNDAISTIVAAVDPDTDANVYLRPDLVSFPAREVFEIKTVAGAAAGAIQLAGYIKGLEQATSISWRPGTALTYTPPSLLMNIWRNIDAEVDPPVGGVITYKLVGSNGNNSGGSQLISLVVTVAVSMMLASLATQLATASANALRGAN